MVDEAEPPKLLLDRAAQSTPPALDRRVFLHDEPHAALRRGVDALTGGALVDVGMVHAAPRSHRQQSKPFSPWPKTLSIRSLG